MSSARPAESTTDRPSTHDPLTRRTLLRSAAFAAVPAALAACGSGSDGAASSSTSTSAGSSAPVRGGMAPGTAAAPLPELAPPPVVSSESGVLRTTLTAQRAKVDIGAPALVDTMTYDGALPGPTWELRPGDRIELDLVNDLPALDHPRHSDDINRPHEWTHTNIHTHGLHVSPEGNSDNVFLSVEPEGGTQRYEIDLPEDHAAGLFWYHPHKHGGVAAQVRAGMGGLIVVRGDVDEVPEVAAAAEKIMVIQALELDKDFTLLDPIPDPAEAEAFVPRDQILYPINGTLHPKVTMYPGEVQRWRILNGAQGKFMSLRLAGHDLHAIAWDGLTLDEPEVLGDALVSGGNRLDVLVKAGEVGTYDLVLTPGSSQHPEIPGSPHPTTPPANVSKELVARPILTVEVVGEGPEMALPSTLPAYDPPIAPIVRRRIVEYTVQRPDDTGFDDFGIDGQPFDPDRPPYVAKLGTAEEWTVVNAHDRKLPQHAHVFHIHVNPFKVTKINGEPVEKPFWRDTYVLNGSDDDSFTMETNFEDFTGQFVQHCHVLSHEDLGMMEKVEVQP